MYYVSFWEYQKPEHIELCAKLWAANTAEALSEYVKIQPHVKSRSFKSRKSARQYIRRLPQTKVFYSLTYKGEYLLQSQQCKEDEKLYKPLVNAVHFIMSIGNDSEQEHSIPLPEH